MDAFVPFKNWSSILALVDVITIYLNIIGTQTCRELDDECLAAVEYAQINNHNNNTRTTNTHSTRTTTTNTHNFGTQIHYDDTHTEVGIGHGSDGTVEDVVVEPVAPFRPDDVILERVDVNGDRRMSLKTSSSVGTGSGRRPSMKTQTHFEPKGK